MTVSSGVELRFVAPDRPLSINQANKLHWAAKRRRLAPWRELAARAWQELPATERPAVLDVPCTVEIDLPFPDSRRRDPHNYVGTVVKALIDELVQQGIWPDDNPEWIRTTEPNLTVGTECVIRLRPRS